MSNKDKLAELYDFLKYDVEISSLDGNIIDVAMDVISRLIERIKKLEKELRTLYWRNEWIKSQEKIGHLEATVQDSKLENTRYREAIDKLSNPPEGKVTHAEEYADYVTKILQELDNDSNDG